MEKEIKRFDMKESPRDLKWYLKPVVGLLTNPAWKKHQPKITYVNTKNIKGPFVLLCNHNAFLDFKIAIKLLGKNKANFVVAIDGYIKREQLLRNVGAICKRKFTNDVVLVRHLKKVIDKGNVAVIYPEARYSLCGTTAVLPESLGKLVKFLNVPVVTLICHGHHVNSPFWDSSHDRGVKPIEATYKLLLDSQQIKEKSVDEINKMIVDDFQYDDFAWQKERNIEINDKNRAKGLHRVLYQCPNCLKEYQMDSFGINLVCNNCHSKWEMTPLGELQVIEGKERFRHIPDWYEWQRENVRQEIKENRYSTGLLDVTIDSLPNAKGFIHLGNGTLIHDMNGFRLNGLDINGKPFELVKEVASLYSCHIEYQYLFKYGDCIDLNTIEDTYYIYPKGNNFNVTKIALATEELYFDYLQKQGKEIKKGLA